MNKYICYLLPDQLGYDLRLIFGKTNIFCDHIILWYTIIILIIALLLCLLYFIVNMILKIKIFKYLIIALTYFYITEVFIGFVAPQYGLTMLIYSQNIHNKAIKSKI